MGTAIIARRAFSLSTPRAKGAPLRASGGDSESAAKQRTPCPRMAKSASRSGQSAEVGAETSVTGFFGPNGLSRGLQGLLLQVEVSEIVMHEADEPNAVVDFLDAELLAGQHGRDVDLLAMQAEPSAGRDDDIAVMEGIGQVRQAGIGAR